MVEHAATRWDECMADRIEAPYRAPEARRAGPFEAVSRSPRRTVYAIHIFGGLEPGLVPMVDVLVDDDQTRVSIQVSHKDTDQDGVSAQRNEVPLVQPQAVSSLVPTCSFQGRQGVGRPSSSRYRLSETLSSLFEAKYR